MIWVAREISLLSLITENRKLFVIPEGLEGVYGSCFTSGANIKCMDSFLGENLALKVYKGACRKPIKLTIELKVVGKRFNEEYSENPVIPLPGLFIGNLSRFILNIREKTMDNGKQKIEIGLKASFPNDTGSAIVLLETIPNSDCNTFLLWWNSQSLITKAGTAVGISLLLIIFVCYYCLCPVAVAVMATKFFHVLPKIVMVPYPSENKYQYPPEVNKIV